MKRNATSLLWFVGVLIALATLPLLLGASIGPNPVVGNLPVAVVGTVPVTSPTGYATVGQGSLTFTGTGTSVLNLSGTASTSVPCSHLVISVAGTGCLVGTSSSSQALAMPAGTLELPVANVNQLWISGGTGNTVGYLYFQ